MLKSDCTPQYVILIADDNVLIRKGLVQLFSKGSDFNARILEACNGKEALHILSNNDIDLVILDERMPEMRGLECAETILKVNPQMKVIALTMYDSIPLILNYLKLGVKGFIAKNQIEIGDLFEAVKTVLDGNYFFRSSYDPEIREHLLEIQLTRPPSIRFSERELQMVIEISKGFSNKETASNLGISVRTIETYRLDLMRKIGVKNTAELIAYVYKNGILGVLATVMLTDVPL